MKEPTSAPSPPAPDPRLLDRVGGMMPAVRGLIGTVRLVGIGSAGAAVVLWVVLFGTAVWPLSVQTFAALVALATLLIPAAGTFLAVLTLNEVLELPRRLRALPGAVRESASEASGHVTGATVPEGGGRMSRVLGFFGVLWRLRGIVGDTQSSWLKALALVRFARLASLPFALALVGAFALNFVVIVVALVVVPLALLL